MRRRISEHRFTFLLGALLLLLIAAPLGPLLRAQGYESAGGNLITLLFALVLVTAIVAVGKSRTTMMIAVALAGPAILLEVIGILLPQDAVSFAHRLCRVLFLVFTVVLLLKYVFTTDRVTFNTISASLCVYMLLGVASRCQRPRSFLLLRT